MGSASRALFFADASLEGGAARVRRCLALAAALGARGASCTFLTSGPVEAMLEHYDANGIVQVRAMAAAAADRPDLVIIDHPGLTVAHEAALRGGARLAVIDDRVRDHAADTVILAGGDLSDLKGDGVLSGPAHALLPAAFADAREAALGRRLGVLRRCLVQLGGDDLDGAIAGLVESVLVRAGGEVALDVIYDGSGSSRAALAEMADRGRITLHLDPVDRSTIITDADLAIGTLDDGVWERAALGLASLVVVRREDQRDAAQALQNAGLAMSIDATSPRAETQLTDAWRRVTGNPMLRRELSERSAAACDGLGAGRVADALLAAG